MSLVMLANVVRFIDFNVHVGSVDCSVCVCRYVTNLLIFSISELLPLPISDDNS